MGYTIMYGKQFIRTTRGIIPLVLAGSSNVWETGRSGRDRRARDWSIFATKFMELPESELITAFREHFDDDCPEVFKMSGKWVDCKGALRFALNGVKEAKTIEEIIKVHPRQSLRCHVSVWPKDGGWSKEKLPVFNITTTSELEEWLDSARAQAEVDGITAESIFYCISFSGSEPLRFPTKTSVSGKVIIKTKAGYVSKIEEPSKVWFTQNIREAMVFENTVSASDVLQETGYNRSIQFIKAEIAANRNYVIIVESGSRAGFYVKKLTATKLHFSGIYDQARSFASEKEALKYIDQKLGSRFPGCQSYSVVDIRSIA